MRLVFADVEPLTPIWHAFDQVEKLLSNYLKDLMRDNCTLTAGNDLDVTEAADGSTEVSLLFIVAVMRDSLGSLLQVVQFLLAKPTLKLLPSIQPFWKQISPSYSLQDALVADGVAFACEILLALERLSKGTAQFAIKSAQDAEALIGFIERNSQFLLQPSESALHGSKNAGARIGPLVTAEPTPELSACAASILNENIGRVKDTIPLGMLIFLIFRNHSSLYRYLLNPFSSFHIF